MTRKLMLPTFFTLGLASASFALDEYMPIPYRVMQINVGFEKSSITGDYGQDWVNNEDADPDDPVGLPVQGKFGLLDGLEMSGAINYLVQDRDGHTGLNRPVLALKYADNMTGYGGFLSISLPVGFEDIMNAGNYATMTFGAMYGKNLPRVKLLANASYSYDTEDDNKNKIDNLRLFGKPEFPIPGAWMEVHKQYLGLSLGFTYDFFFNRMLAGVSSDRGAHHLSVAPGLTYVFNKIVTTEITAPLSLAGQNHAAFQTLRAQLYFTLDETLYNAL